jgi:hypothetical protein
VHCPDCGIKIEKVLQFPSRAPFSKRFEDAIRQVARRFGMAASMMTFIRTTSTQTGLVVTAYLDRKEHPTGLKPGPQLISSLRLTSGRLRPRWNYTIRPNL